MTIHEPSLCLGPIDFYQYLVHYLKNSTIHSIPMGGSKILLGVGGGGAHSYLGVL